MSVSVALMLACAMPRSVVLPISQPPAGLGGVMSAACQEAIRRGLVLLQPQKRPVGPSEPDAAKGIPLPEPKTSAPNPNSLLIHHADSLRRSGSKINAQGNVSFSYRGYDVLADEAAGDLTTDIFTLYGNVHLLGEAQDVRGERVVVDFRNKSFAFDNASSKLGPSFVKGGLLKDIFVKGRSGSGDRRQLFGEGSELTSCDRDEPHYEFVAGSSDVKPGRRAILRKVKLIVLGRKIAEFPYLVIPLHDYGDQDWPEVGHSQDEGYYAKTKWSSELPGDSWWDTRVDYFSKLGAGLGGDLHYFGPSKMRGLLRAYAITGRPHSQLYSFDHNQGLLGGALRLTGEWQKDNYLTSPGNRNYNTRLSYLLNGKGSTTRLGFTRSSTKSASFGSLQQNMSLSDARTWTKTLRTNLDMNLASTASNSGSSSSNSRRQLDVRFRGTEELDRATAMLEYQRSIPIGKIQNFFGFADQTPQITLSSDARKLISARAAESFPFTTSLAFGELTNSVKRNRLTRTAFDFASQNSHYATNQSGASYGLRFRQGFYSDGTAQYQLGTDLGVRYAFAKRSTFDMRYSYLRPYGFTPLSIDASGETNQVYADMSYKLHRTLNLGAQSSYDILQLKKKATPWQTVSVRSEWKPNPKLLVRSLANYDTYNRFWSNVRMDLGWKAAGGYISAGTRFDGGRHTWGSLNVMADGLQWGRLKSSVLLSYNGYSKQFEARHFSFTYDLHCAEAILQIIDNPVGFRSGRTIAFYIRLKALPFETPFGIGQRGQAIGTGSGFGF